MDGSNRVNYLMLLHKHAYKGCYLSCVNCGYVENLAKKSIRKEPLGLPYTVKGMSLSFSGLVTAAIRLYQTLQDFSKEDFCYA